MKLKIIKKGKKRKFWIHNVDNSSLTLYFTINCVNTLSILKRVLNKTETKYIFVRNFNLHYLLWNKSTKFTQHVMTNKLIVIVDETDFHKE